MPSTIDVRYTHLLLATKTSYNLEDIMFRYGILFLN